MSTSCTALILYSVISPPPTHTHTYIHTYIQKHNRDSKMRWSESCCVLTTDYLQRKNFFIEQIWARLNNSFLHACSNMRQQCNTSTASTIPPPPTPPKMDNTNKQENSVSQAHVAPSCLPCTLTVSFENSFNKPKYELISIGIKHGCWHEASGG